jgi:hypothetical protein
MMYHTFCHLLFGLFSVWYLIQLHLRVCNSSFQVRNPSTSSHPISKAILYLGAEGFSLAVAVGIDCLGHSLTFFLRTGMESVTETYFTLRPKTGQLSPNSD